MTFYGHLFHLQGVTELEAQRAQAVKRQKNGESTWVHGHAFDQECNDNCQLFEPTKE